MEIVNSNYTDKGRGARRAKNKAMLSFDLVACGFQHGDALKAQLKNLAT